MAHELSQSKKTRVHQALHGYADGHRQLALSAPLKPRDQKTMLALSDISGPGARLDKLGYLTGYPLPDSGVFALARTWPATEMPRPGCVWTHTLLIDFTDLAALETLTSLSDLFKRPTDPSSFQEYGSSKRLDAAPPPEMPNNAGAWMRQVMAALYGKPRNCIVVARPNVPVDDAILALWSQQWPRLRRSFRFCTFAASDRSVESASFDLQVFPSFDRSVRSRFSHAVDAETAELNGGVWLEDALLDLAQPDYQGLRSFFRKLGPDVAVGREAFGSLCRLHRALNAFATDPEAVHDAIAILQSELGTKQARTARAVVVKAAVETVETLDGPSFDFLWANLSMIDAGALRTFAARLGRSAWHRDPRMLAKLLNDDSETKIVVDHTLAELDINELIQGLRQTPELVGAALRRRPEIVGQPSFWTNLEAVDAPLEEAGNEGLQSVAVAAIIKSGRSDLALRAVREFGGRVVLQTLNDTLDVMGDRIEAWVQAVADDMPAVAEFLATHPDILRPILYTLARALPPDAVPNDFGSDPWLNAWRNSTGSIDAAASAYLSAYVLSRALGSRSRSPGELAQLSFETTHTAAAHNHLPDEVWRVLEPRLPWSVFWFDWDRCQRLRVGVIDLFLDRDLPPGIFAGLVENDHLFQILASGAARSSRGRKYLRRVRRAIIDENPEYSSRVQQLEKLLD
jgi:hypothetical protein